MSRDELLTKLAMELGEWPSDVRSIRGPLLDMAMWAGESASSPFNPVALHSNMKGVSAIRESHYLAERERLINKPSWDDAPEWATHLCQRGDGVWKWYPQKPHKSERWKAWAHDKDLVDGQCSELASRGKIPAGHNWRDTLEPRPQAQSKPQTCRHCDITFNRPRVDGIPDDRCTRCDDEIKAQWPEREPVKTWWTSKKCTQCGHTTAAKVSDDNPVCPGCVALGPDISDGGLDISSGQYAKAPCGSDADSILSAAVRHMRDRAATYDKPQGERSMAATVDAFRATTGIELAEEQGWHFMALLKLVRSQQGELRMDSYEDGAAYMALAGEAAAKGRK